MSTAVKHLPGLPRLPQKIIRQQRRTMPVGPWTIAGGVALVLVAAAVIANFDDIRRYLKISRM